MFQKIGIAADDLTGAADTGVQICPHFDDVLLVVHNRISYEVIEPVSASCHALAVYEQSCLAIEEDVNGCGTIAI